MPAQVAHSLSNTWPPSLDGFDRGNGMTSLEARAV